MCHTVDMIHVQNLYSSNRILIWNQFTLKFLENCIEFFFGFAFKCGQFHEKPPSFKVEALIDGLICSREKCKMCWTKATWRRFWNFEIFVKSIFKVLVHLKLIIGVAYDPQVANYFIEWHNWGIYWIQYKSTFNIQCIKLIRNS